MKDPYETLGVNRSATGKEIKDAFKKLARKFHPDLHPGDKEAEAKFKEISAANDLLEDKEKRRRFDAGEIDASGAERPQQRFYRDFADGPAYASHAAQDGFANNEELEEFLARAFAGGKRRSQATFRTRGQDVSYVLPVGFLEVANGAARTISLPEGKTLQVMIPEGAEDRQMLRLKEQGMPGFGGGPAGDAYVELHVEPHPFFRRKDDNIHVEVPVTLREAALGARIDVPTIGGPVTVTVPKGSNTGTTLRLRDRGIRNHKSGQRGHQLITLKVVLPVTLPEWVKDHMSVRKREWTTRSGEAKSAWVVDYADAKGVRRLKTFSRKKEADAFAATASVEVRQGVHVADSDAVTVAMAGRLWLATAQNRELERATVDNYRRHLDIHIVPFLGPEKLSRITVPSVRAFEDRLKVEGRSPDLIKKVLVALGSLLADAQERGLVARNAVQDVRRKRKGRSASENRHKRKLQVGIDIPSPEEARRLIRILEHPQFAMSRPLIVTACLTGLRVSELRGLPWRCVDFDKREIYVRQRADRFGKIGRPKSEAGERVVPMPPTVVSILRGWRLSYPRPLTGEREAKGSRMRAPASPDHLVFPNGEGNAEFLTNILKRVLWPACVAAGLTVPSIKDGKPVLDSDGNPVLEAKYSMHGLRHFYASWCINRPQDGGLGLPPKVVQERLGHSTIAMTMDTYGHLFPRGDDTEELANAERALLG